MLDVVTVQLPVLDSATLEREAWCVTFGRQPPSAMTLQPCGPTEGAGQAFAWESATGELRPLYEGLDAEKDADAAEGEVARAGALAGGVAWSDAPSVRLYFVPAASHDQLPSSAAAPSQVGQAKAKLQEEEASETTLPASSVAPAADTAASAALLVTVTVSSSLTAPSATDPGPAGHDASPRVKLASVSPAADSATVTETASISCAMTVPAPATATATGASAMMMARRSVRW